MNNIARRHCHQISLKVLHLSGRSLILTASDPEFVDLADDSLPSISLKEQEPDTFESVAKLTRLTSLTRIEMRDMWAGDSLTSLRGLPLQELVLLDCPGVTYKLFAPAALTTLRRLHVEDVYCDEVMFEEKPGCSRAFRQQLQKLGDTVLQLPALMQVSGRSNLLARGMKQGLEMWEDSEFTGGTMVSLRCFHRVSPGQMKIWRKPASQ